MSPAAKERKVFAKRLTISSKGVGVTAIVRRIGTQKLVFVALLFLTGCGYQFSPKEITLVNGKGEATTAYSCGQHMQVSSEGWGSSTFEVTFTDGNGVTHDLYGVNGVGVADIPSTVEAPMWAFSSDYFPGERYSNNADGTLGNEMKEGDIVVRGDNQARVMNGKWTPVKVPNPACKKH